MYARTRGALFVTAMTLMLGCGSSQPRAVWRDAKCADASLKTWVVFAGRLDEPNRHALEDRFVRELARHGVRAVASYRILPNQIILPDKVEARETLDHAGYQVALVAAARGANQPATYAAASWSGGFWSDFYGPGWGAPWSPDYGLPDDNVDFETTLWDLRGDGRMIWSAVARTDNPRDGKGFAKSVVEAIVPTLLDNPQ